MKVLKWLGLGIGFLFLGFLLFVGVMFYKVKYGFPIYEKTPPELSLSPKDFNVLLYTKTNGFRHESAIAGGAKMFETLAKKNNWNLIQTENGAVFNPELLPFFDVVIWNNVTGRNLNKTQKEDFKNYMLSGGHFIGIHGAGDDSHRWPWYYDTLINAHFSHHSMNPHLQVGTMALDSTSGFAHHEELKPVWLLEEEWYVFYDNPREYSANVLYTLDESNISTNGNLPPLAKNKDFGMGDDHPVVWYRCLDGGGKTFYTALGHQSTTFEDENFKTVIEKAVLWATNDASGCD